MRLTVLPGWLLLVVWQCSCATLHQSDGIDITLVNLRLGETTVWETTAYFTVRISNETPEPFLLNGSAHKFYLNGLYIGQGLNGDALEVPRLNSATQEVTVHLRNFAMAARLRPIFESKAVDYQVQSTLYLGETGHSRACRVAHQGRLALTDFQPNLQEEGKNP